MPSLESICLRIYSSSIADAKISNWDPYDFPESLLLEIENGILIRDVQEHIARRMRKIRPRQNAVMQLNMGEGKSSVIVPIVAADFANGSCLARVLVAKPQSRQMHQMLVSKLGGILNRQIYQLYQLPISRSLRIDLAEANEIARMCCECMEQGDILLVQTEYILSLKLMCLESFITGKNELGKSILRTLELFNKSSRDIVDESDENFSDKFELIYTMGIQQPLELSPQRWMIIQEVLELFRNSAVEIKEKFLHSIEVVHHQQGSFPRIRIFHESAAQEILNRIAQHVCQKGIDSMATLRQTEPSLSSMITYILKRNLSAQEIGAVETGGPYSFWTESTKDSLLLLRGLLAGGVLAFCFGQKRWRVNYGPDNSRRPPTKLSVPYRAKDNPAPRDHDPNSVIQTSSSS